MRTFYSEYVQHCMRFYARHPNPKFHSDADKQNWNACDVAMNTFSPSDAEILLTVYRAADTISDNIYAVSSARGIDPNYIWKIVNVLERRIAKRRTLI